MRERGEAAGPRVVVLDDDPSGRLVPARSHGQRTGEQLSGPLLKPRIPGPEPASCGPTDNADSSVRAAGPAAEAVSSAGTALAIPAFRAIGEIAPGRAASITPASSRPSNLRAAIFPGTVVGPQALVEASGAAG